MEAPPWLPMTLDPIGVDISWSVQRSVLQTTGLSCTVNVATGLVQFGARSPASRRSARDRSSCSRRRRTRSPPRRRLPERARDRGRVPGNRDRRNSEAGAIRIDGAGDDIWANGDQFMYAYNSVTGDFSARVAISERALAPASRWGKHGIMARRRTAGCGRATASSTTTARTSWTRPGSRSGPRTTAPGTSSSGQSDRSSRNRTQYPPARPLRTTRS